MDGRSLTGMDRAGCSAGRFSIHSAMASFRRGASAQPPGEALAELEGRWGRCWSWLFPLALEPSQTGPEGRVDLPSPPGNQQKTPGQAEGVGTPQAVSTDQQAQRPSLPGFWAAHLDGKSSRRWPALPSSCFSLRRQVPACRCWDPLAPGSPLSTKALPFLSAHPALPSPLGIWVPGPSRSLRHRGSSAGLPSLPLVNGSLQGP